MNMTKIIIFLLIGSFLSCESTRQSEKNKKDKDISLTKELNKIYNQGYINGFSVAAVNKDSVIYQKGFGYADIERKELYTENTVQNIASISKTLIGIALLKAQEMGKLNLDDPINKYLPYKVLNPFYPKEVITIRHLATHTSTIKDTEFYGNKSYVLKDDVKELSDDINGMYVKLNTPETYISMTEFVEKVLSTKGDNYLKEGFLNNKPGALFEYSNVGATLAAVILEIATDDSFINFTTKHILEPLEMSSSGWAFEDIDLSRHSKLYLNPKSEIPFYTLITFPDGGLITSTCDLSKYLIELINGYSGSGILLTQESYNEFFSKQLKEKNFSNQKGENEGVFVSFSAEGNIGHSGSDPGVSTYMFFNPTSKTGNILFVNTDFGLEGEKQYKDILEKLADY